MKIKNTVENILCVLLLILISSSSFANNKTLSIQSLLINLPKKYNYLAPDDSQTRLLGKSSRGNMAHFTLPPHTTSKAIHQRSVQELWYFLSGTGQVWLKYKGKSEIYKVSGGSSLTLPNDIDFQFRNLSNTKNLVFLDVTMPPWPGDSVISYIKGPWKPTIPASNS